MEFDHVTYESGTGRRSKEVETYNFHKAAAVLAEYGFDCLRVADDWMDADFLAHHKRSGKTLMVQLKSALVIDQKYTNNEDLYMCFPLDRTGNWYLIKHQRLLEIAKEHAPQWFCTRLWKEQERYWSWRATPAVRKALKGFAYRSLHCDLGFRECNAPPLQKDGPDS